MANHNLMCETETGGDDGIKFGVFYEIKHAYLPPNAPDKLKATHLVMVNCQN